ncbi:Uncharacterized protein FKW44_010621 [Caligus rogercresseyi]|uniref:UBZ1-type domain-containing protein n=1 Tax=Caligus rogercresseyi TaxID=217165 RepID=A0A7T8K9N9_CALRO|nr:Uncharacterized protein FKW44_010621 [Caligus rogercresseyi]|eukprot:TRINITY_DN2914_c0_g1_i2.p1 TRINITY_DN2914_c0_g1~~TRINITY_DN2914_c0_g1_i2.p1  ORF type:complete len:177 (-),score=61.83 TRINITY_DN2914_c0_g1_i2:349-879(-)
MSGPSRLVQLESAKISLEEKCRVQEKRIQELEKENATLLRSRREVYEEVKSLHTGNISLRERNLKLGRELARLSKENIRLERERSSLESGGGSPDGEEENWKTLKDELLLQRRILFQKVLPILKSSLPTFERICPMCECHFSPSNTSQMEFENHVIQHFACDEEEFYDTSSNSFSS